MKAMLKTLSWSVTLAVAGVVSEGCRQPSGAVMDTVIREMLCAPRMALTPCNPAWVLERREIHPLSAVQISQVRDLLRKCPVPCAGAILPRAGRGESRRLQRIRFLSLRQ